MKTQVSTIIRDVETALNEIDPNQASFVGDRDHSDLQTLIESKIEESVDRIHRQADISRMALDATIDIHYDGDTSDPRFRFRQKTGVLNILLRSHTEGFDDTFGVDMLRMVSARSKSWPFAVRDVIYADDPLYEIVTDRYVGAQSDFPAVTWKKKRIDTDGRRVVVSTLELRCLNSSDEWADVCVIPRAKIQNGLVDVDSALYHEVIGEIVNKLGIRKPWSSERRAK